MRRIEEADEETRRGLVLKLLTGLKQICNHPAHFLRQPNPKLRGRSEKLELLDELVGTVDRRGRRGPRLHPVRRHGAAARAPPRRPPACPTSSCTAARRSASATRWSRASRPARSPVFLLSLKAGGTGLNLTGADHVLHFDRWWNPAVEDQATDRAYRIGQTRPVQVHRFVTQGTIEEKIAELLDPQALHRRLGPGPRRDRADRALRRRAPRPRRAAAMSTDDPPARRTPACRPGAAAAPAPGGARRCCARSRRPPSAPPTSGPGGRWRAPGRSARSPSATAVPWRRSRTATTPTPSR